MPSDAPASAPAPASTPAPAPSPLEGALDAATAKVALLEAQLANSETARNVAEIAVTDLGAKVDGANGLIQSLAAQKEQLENDLGAATNEARLARQDARTLEARALEAEKHVEELDEALATALAKSKEDVSAEAVAAATEKARETLRRLHAAVVEACPRGIRQGIEQRVTPEEIAAVLGS